MNIKWIVTLLAGIAFSGFTLAGDIGFGKITGIKVYDFPTGQVTKIHFNKAATHKDEAACSGIGTITHGLHTPEIVAQMTSVALAGYMSGKNIRAYSYETGKCEIDLIAVQDGYD